jgi:predicted small metal-binding protein
MNMLMEVTCRCGWTTRGSKSEVIASIQAHGKAEHGLDVTPEEIRAVWRVVRDDAPPARRTGGQ